MPAPDDPTDAARAATANADREAALREILGMPDRDPAVLQVSRPIPDVVSSPTPKWENPSQPVIPTIPERGNPWTVSQIGLFGLVLILAATLLVMTVTLLRSRARAAQCARDLRTLASIFERYHRETGDWPPPLPAHAAIPPSLETILPADLWSRPTPFGGHYAWGTASDRSALVITAFVPDAPLAISQDELRRLDQRLDDGDPATGSLRVGFNGWPIYSVGAKN